MTTTFDYKVRDQMGNLVVGKLEADSIPIVVTKFREMGYLPVSVRPAKGAGLKTEIIIPGFSDRIKPKEVAVFTRQFATMVDSGLSISRSINVLAQQVENKHFAIMLRQIHDDLDSGLGLSAALAKHPKVFDNLYVSMVAAGEVGGSIDIVLKNVAENLEKQVELNRKVKGAMTYPIIVVCRDHGDRDGDDGADRSHLQEAVREPGRQASGTDPNSSSRSPTPWPAGRWCW